MTTIPVEFKQMTGADLLVNEEPSLKTSYSADRLQHHFRTLAKRLKLAAHLRPVGREYENEQILEWAKKRAKKNRN